MEDLNLIKEIIGLLGTGSGLIVLVVLAKLGLLSKNGNGKNGHKEIEDLKQQITVLQDNHLHTLEEKIDRLTERMVEHNAVEVGILREIERKIK